MNVHKLKICVFLLEVTMFSTENKNRTRIIWEPTKNGTLKELSKTGLVGKFKLKYHFKSQEPVNDIVVFKYNSFYNFSCNTILLFV